MIVKRYKKLFKNDEVFKEVCKEISLKKPDICVSNQILKSFILDKFIPCLKKNDRHFDQLHTEVKFVGSYYKKLKIDKPNEFDLNLVIDLPIDDDAMKIDTNHSDYGFVKIKVDKSRFKKSAEFWISMLDGDGYLDQYKFRSWIQGVCDKAMRDMNYVLKSNRNIYKVDIKQHNPAFTLHIESKTSEENNPIVIDFDLVPCIKFENKILPGFNQNNQPHEILVVARPLWTTKKVISNTSWIVNFYKHEKTLLKGHIKAVIRVMKKLCNNQQMFYINSYLLETLFLHALANKSFRNVYETVSRTCVLMSLLRRLLEILETRKLSNYWHKKHNILWNKDEQKLQHASNIIKYMINTVERNPSKLEQYFNLKNA